jgi:hypothetical protein
MLNYTHRFKIFPALTQELLKGNLSVATEAFNDSQFLHLRLFVGITIER